MDIATASVSEQTKELDTSQKPISVTLVITKYSVMCSAMEKELEGIIPAVSKRVGSVHLFAFLARRDVDPFSRRLLERTLGLMQTDYSMPAPVKLVDEVKKFIATTIVVSKETGATGEETESVVDEDEATVKLLVPVLGAMTTQEVYDILPKLVRVLDDQSDVLLNAFRRIYSARPPPLSKAALFAALHSYRIICTLSYSYFYYYLYYIAR